MRIKIDGIYLNYELTGNGDYFTFIHGLGADLTAWQEQVLVFSDHYQVLTPDLRGFGWSDKPRGPYSVKMLSNDLYGLFRALSIKKTILAGHSMGGMTAMTFALDHPEMVTALVLVGTSAAMTPDVTDAIMDSANIAETQGMEPIVDAVMGRAFSTAFARHYPETFALHRELRLRNDPMAYAAASRAIVQLNLTTQLEHITCPTLIIVGDQDIPTPPDDSHVLHKGILTSQLRVIKDSGHNTMVEQPDKFDAAVTSFLKGINM